jgi:hypothetical protein
LVEVAPAAFSPDGPPPPLPPPEGIFLSRRPKIEVFFFLGCESLAVADVSPAAASAVVVVVVAVSSLSLFSSATIALGEDAAAGEEARDATAAVTAGIAAAAHVILRLGSNVGRVPASSAAAPSAERWAWRAWARAGCVCGGSFFLEEVEVASDDDDDDDGIIKPAAISLSFLFVLLFFIYLTCRERRRDRDKADDARGRRRRGLHGFTQARAKEDGRSRRRRRKKEAKEKRK